MTEKTCSVCKRPQLQSGPLSDGMCQYCAAEKRCYVCGCEVTTSGVMGPLCGTEECDKVDEFRTYQHYLRNPS